MSLLPPKHDHHYLEVGGCFYFFVYIRVTKTFFYVFFDCVFQTVFLVCDLSGIHLCTWLYNFIFPHREISLCNLVVCGAGAVVCQVNIYTLLLSSRFSHWPSCLVSAVPNPTLMESVILVSSWQSTFSILPVSKFT